MFANGHVYFIFCSYTPEPHEKISLCVCEDTPLFFWINTNASFHGVGQELIRQTDLAHVLTHDSYIDLSGLKQYAPKDLARARPCGDIGKPLRNQVVAALTGGNRMLAEQYRTLAISNLSPPAVITSNAVAAPKTN